MKKQELIEWALKGLDAEIFELEKDIRKGVQYLLQFERGEKPKIPKTEYEVKEIIASKRNEVEKLSKIKFDLKWELSELEQK